jgi:hypothetical protein
MMVMIGQIMLRRLTPTLLVYLLAVAVLYGEESSIRTLNPRGTPPAIRLTPMAPRPSSLDGKTVYFVDVRFMGGDLLLKEMMSWFASHMPAVKLVFREKSGAYAETDPKLWAEIREKGDAAIIAIGH